MNESKYNRALHLLLFVMSGITIMCVMISRNDTIRAIKASAIKCTECGECEEKETGGKWFKKHDKPEDALTPGWHIIEGENRRKLVMVVNTIQGRLMVYDPEQRDSFKTIGSFTSWRWIGSINLEGE